MTNYRIPALPDPTTALDAIATAMINEGGEPRYDLIEHYATLLSPTLFIRLCDMLDLCPEHLTDTDTCYDDDLDCRESPDA